MPLFPPYMALKSRIVCISTTTTRAALSPAEGHVGLTCGPGSRFFPPSPRTSDINTDERQFIMGRGCCASPANPFSTTPKPHSFSQMVHGHPPPPARPQECPREEIEHVTTPPSPSAFPPPPHRGLSQRCGAFRPPSVRFGPGLLLPPPPSPAAPTHSSPRAVFPAASLSPRNYSSLTPEKPSVSPRTPFSARVSHQHER